jgi:aldehyde:ferredoxin oxidoreductase
MNARLGFGAVHDRYPEPFKEPLEEGGAAGYVPPFEEMLEAYYDARGWSQTTGMPGIELLRDLGLENYNT